MFFNETKNASLAISAWLFIAYTQVDLERLYASSLGIEQVLKQPLSSYFAMRPLLLLMQP
jgi:hypothetical protein